MRDTKLILLMKSANHKDRNRAFEVIYDTVFPLFRNYLLKNSGSEEVAMDLFQDAVVIFHEHVILDRFKGNSSISTYLFGISRKLWFQHLKTEKSQLRYSINEEVTEKISASDQEKVIQGKVIEQLLGQLGANCQKILRLYYIEEKSIAEIKEFYQLGSDQAAKTKKYRCMQKLIELFKKHDITKEKLLNY